MSSDLELIRAGKFDDYLNKYSDTNIFYTTLTKDLCNAISKIATVDQVKTIFDKFSVASHKETFNKFILACASEEVDNNKMLKLLIDYGANVNIIIAHKNMVSNDCHPLEYSILELMCDYDKIKCAKLLLEYGADPNINNSEALIFACKRGNYEIVKLLIFYGVNVDVQNNLAIMMAITAGKPKIVKLLLENGADINEVNNFFTSNKDLANGMGSTIKKYNKLTAYGIDPINLIFIKDWL